MTNKIYTLIILLSFFTAPAISQTILSGKITTTKNLPVSNGSISILNSNINSISDSNGLFKIKLPAAGNYQLEINHFNFASIHPVIKIESNKNNYTANFILEASMNTLDEIIVTAQKKEALPISLLIFYLIFQKVKYAFCLPL